MVMTAVPAKELMPKLTPRQELAVLARSLWREGYDDHTAGHIAYHLPDGSFLVTPFELAWDEVAASDVVHIDGDANVLDGRWTASPAIILHIELHRMRDDAVISVHHHPHHATLWSTTLEIPPSYDQTGSLAVTDQIGIVDEYGGNADDPFVAKRTAEQIGRSNIALLANHGVLVIGGDAREAHFRSLAIEWRCRLAWGARAMGAGRPIPSAGERAFLTSVLEDRPHYPNFWEAAVRREIRLDPGVLT